jgi:hypothetical protein
MCTCCAAPEPQWATYRIMCSRSATQQSVITEWLCCAIRYQQRYGGGRVPARRITSMRSMRRAGHHGPGRVSHSCLYRHVPLIGAAGSSWLLLY